MSRVALFIHVYSLVSLLFAFELASQELNESDANQVSELLTQSLDCEVASIGTSCAPQIPYFTNASLSGQNVVLQWGVDSAYDYFLLGQSTNGTWGNDETIFINSTSRTLISGNTYYFRVAACSYMHDCSDYVISQSIFVSGSGGGVPTATYLPPPAEVIASISGSTLTLNWGASANVVSYRVRQNVNGTWQTEINKGTTRTHNFTIITNNIYSYQVRSCNASAQCSNWSVGPTINTSPAVTYIHTDMQGSIIGESNQHGVMLKKTEHHPYGERKEQ